MGCPITQPHFPPYMYNGPCPWPIHLVVLSKGEFLSEKLKFLRMKRMSLDFVATGFCHIPRFLIFQFVVFIDYFFIIYYLIHYLIYR